MSAPAEDWVTRDLQRLQREGRILYPPTQAEWERIWTAATTAVASHPEITSIEPFVMREVPALLRAARVLPSQRQIPRGAMVCTRCLHVGYPKERTNGSLLIEIVLWLFMIVPGLIYSIWRLTSRQNVCAKCQSAELVPGDSDRARQLLGA